MECDSTPLILRAYKTELHVNDRESSVLLRCCGAARFVFNWALGDRIARKERGESTNKYEQKRRFNALKGPQVPWLYEVPYTITEAAFDHCDLAFQNFFRRVRSGETPGFPKFKSRHGRQAFTVRGTIVIERHRVRLPVIGWLRLAERGYLPADNVKILSANISLDAGHWMISLQVESPAPPPVELCSTLAVHLGVAKLATLSNGDQFENPKNLLKYEKNLAHAQRELSRRKRGSQNRAKSKQRVAKLHRRIANCRRYALHEVSHNITFLRPERIIIQDWDVSGMVEGQPISVELDKRIMDASMGEARRQIEYKAKWHGEEVQVISSDKPVSQRCHLCGEINKGLKLGQKRWICPSCGVEHDREQNAVENLLYYAR